MKSNKTDKTSFLRRHEGLQGVFTDAENRKIPYRLLLGALSGRVINSFSAVNGFGYGASRSLPGKLATVVVLSYLMDKPADLLYYRRAKYNRAREQLAEAMKQNDTTAIRKHASYIHWYKRKNSTPQFCNFLRTDPVVHYDCIPYLRAPEIAIQELYPIHPVESIEEDIDAYTKDLASILLALKRLRETPYVISEESLEESGEKDIQV